MRHKADELKDYAMTGLRAQEKLRKTMTREMLAQEIKNRVEARMAALYAKQMTRLAVVRVAWNERDLDILAGPEDSSRMCGLELKFMSKSRDDIIAGWMGLVQKAACLLMSHERYVNGWAGHICSLLAKEEGRLVGEGRLEKPVGWLSVKESLEMEEEIKGGRTASQPQRL